MTDWHPEEPREGRGMSNWQPIETAPKDGTVILLTWMENSEPQEIWALRWCHIQRNGLFPGKVGMWTAPSGALTWNDDGGGGPTHWKPLPPSPPPSSPRRGPSNDGRP